MPSEKITPSIRLTSNWLSEIMKFGVLAKGTAQLGIIATALSVSK